MNLTPAQAREVRRLQKAGSRVVHLAARFKISPEEVRKLCNIAEKARPKQQITKSLLVHRVRFTNSVIQRRRIKPEDFIRGEMTKSEMYRMLHDAVEATR